MATGGSSGTAQKTSDTSVVATIGAQPDKTKTMTTKTLSNYLAA
jgi:hypothetical protein